MTGVSTMFAALQAASKNVGTKAKGGSGTSHQHKPAQVGPCFECGAMGHVASNCPHKKGKGIAAACCSLLCGMCVALQARVATKGSSVEGSWRPTRRAKEMERDMEGRMVLLQLLRQIAATTLRRRVGSCALHQASIADEREKLAALLASK